MHANQSEEYICIVMFPVKKAFYGLYIIASLLLSLQIQKSRGNLFSSICVILFSVTANGKSS